MARPDPRFERGVLVASAAVTVALAALALAWGLAIGSQLILFDGIFGFVGVALSVLTLRASKVSAAEPTAKYPYGRQSATPLVIGLQGFVILGTLAYGAVEAALTIRDGGSDFQPGWAVLYAVIVTVVSLGTWLWVRSRLGGSDLLGAEATAWRVAALSSVGVMVGFLVMWGLSRSSWSDVAPYVDPAMVLIICVIFLPDPLRLLRLTYVELMEGAPADEVQQPVREEIERVRREFSLPEPEIRMTKVGRKLYVEVDIVAHPDTRIGKEHEIRTVLERRLEALPYEVWLNLELIPEPGNTGITRG